MSNATMTLAEWTPFLKTLGDLIARGAYDASVEMEGTDILVVKNSACTGTVSLTMAPREEGEKKRSTVLIPVIRIAVASKTCESIEEFDQRANLARAVRDALVIAQAAIENVRLSVRGD